MPKRKERLYLSYTSALAGTNFYLPRWNYLYSFALSLSAHRGLKTSTERERWVYILFVRFSAVCVCVYTGDHWFIGIGAGDLYAGLRLRSSRARSIRLMRAREREREKAQGWWTPSALELGSLLPPLQCLILLQSRTSIERGAGSSRYACLFVAWLEAAKLKRADRVYFAIHIHADGEFQKSHFRYRYRLHFCSKCL